LIGVLLLISMVMVFAIIGVQIVGSSTSDSTQQSRSVMALALAESGVENSIRRLQLGLANCDATLAIAAPGQAFGQGSFIIANGLTTDFDGATVLPASQCRVRSTGVMTNYSRTVEAIVDFAGAGGAIAYDNSNSASRNNSSSINWNLNVGAGSNRILLVGASIRPNTASTGATYSGVSMTLLGSAVSPAPNRVRVDVYYLLNPPTGNNAVVVTFPANVRVVAGSVSLNSVNQIPPAWNASNGTGWFSSTTINTTADNSWVVDVIAKQTNQSFTPLSGQQVRWEDGAGVGPSGGANRVRGAGATRGPISPAGAVTNSWFSFASRPWSAVSVAAGPATGGGSVIRWREIARPP